MIDLSVLGTVALRKEDGSEVQSLLVRPKVMALLSYLCVAEPAGFHQRNSLLALLWPESDDQRARSSLRNALHTIRAELGSECLRARGDDEIAIDPARLRCDATEFEALLRASRLEEALALYRGPLLNGFVVTGLADYQQWLDNRRESLKRRAIEATTRLADAAEKAGNLAGALEWVRRLDALAPYEEVVIRRRLSLLDRLGDRIAAGRAFDQWAARLRADFDSEPSAETIALVTRIRGAGAPAHVAANDAPITVSAASVLARPRSRFGLATRAIAATVLLIVVVVASVLAMRRNEPRAGSIGTAILPFAYHGDRESSYLGPAMASLMGASFGTSGPMASVDERAVAALVGSEPSMLDARAAHNVARTLGARYYVAGSVVTAHKAMRVEAALYETSGGSEPIARAVGEGDADSLFAIAERVARDLVAAGIGTVSPAGLGTTSIVALREYMLGEQSLLAARYVEAADHFDRATAADSLFARGWYRLGYASGWGSQNDRAVAATKRAMSLAGRLNPKDRQLLEGWNQFLKGEVATADRLYEDYLAHDSRSVEAWLQLGELRYHWGAMLGYSPMDAAIAFRHVLALSPNQAVALIHVARTLGREDPLDASAFDSVQRAALALPIDPIESLEMRALGAVRHADTAAQREILAEAASRPAVAAILTRLLIPVRGDPWLANALAHTMFRRADSDEPLYGAGQIANLLATRGRYAAAGAILDTLARTSPSAANELRAWLSLVPTRPTSAAERMSLRTSLAKESARVSSPRNLYMMGALAIQDADTAAARRIVVRLSEVKGDKESLARSYARLLNAELLMETSPGGALDTLGPLSVEPGATFPDLGSFVNARERFLRAQMLEKAGRRDEALRWLSSFPDPSSYDTWFLVPALSMRARMKEASGDRVGARVDYERLVHLWDNADAAVQPLVLQARAFLKMK